VGNDVWKPDETYAAARILEMQRDPGVFIREILGLEKLWEGQEQVMRAIASHSRVAVPSGHALGKDYISAALILWFVYCFPRSIVIATAPSDRQVDNVIWGEVSEKWNNSRMKLGGRCISKYIEVDDKQKWYAIGFTTKDVNKTQGKFQGFHAPHILVIFSEAQAIERNIWDQADTLLASGNAKMLAIGNPILSYGAFYEAIQPKSEFNIVRLDCEDSPNVKTGKNLIPGLCTREWVDHMAKKHGRESPTYKMKVNGIPPKSSSNIPIQPDWIEWANGTGMETISEEGPHVVGLDPAGMGTNKTVFARRRGMKITDLKKCEKTSTTEVTGLAVGYINEGAHLVIDATGGSIGVGIYERLVELGFKDKVTPVNFGSAVKPPPDMKEEDLKNPAKNPALRYANVATQMHDHTANLLENRKIGMPFDEDLNLQLLTRKMERLSNGKIRLETKDDYGHRGYESPDESDAVDLCLCDPGEGDVSKQPWSEESEDETLGRIYS
jgi:hypothetical protein